MVGVDPAPQLLHSRDPAAWLLVTPVLVKAVVRVSHHFSCRRG